MGSMPASGYSWVWNCFVDSQWIDCLFKFVYIFSLLYTFWRLWHWSSSSMPLRAVTSKTSISFQRNWVTTQWTSRIQYFSSIFHNVPNHKWHHKPIKYFVYQMSMLQACTCILLTHTWLSSQMNKPNTWAWVKMAPSNPVTTGDECV